MKKNTIDLPDLHSDQFWTVRWSADGSSIVVELKDATRLFDNIIASDMVEVTGDFEYVHENLIASAELLLEQIESKKDLVEEVNDKLIGDWI